MQPSLIEESSLAQLKRELDSSLTLKQVAEMLGLVSRRVIELIKVGILSPLRGPLVDGCSDWKFGFREIKRIADKIEKLVKSPSPSLENNVSFSSAIKNLALLKIKPIQFIRDIIEGTVRPCGREKKRHGFSMLLFSEDEISKYARIQRRALLADKYSIKEVAELWKVTEQTIYLLVRNRMLGESGKTSQALSQMLITTRELAIFDSTYVLSSKLARDLGTSSSYLKQILTDVGVQPITSPKVSGCQSVFRKADLEKINLTKLISKARTRNRLKLKPKLINLRQASEILGVSKEVVRDLVKRGVLKSHLQLRRKDGNGNKCIFSNYTVEKYRNSISDYIGLVSAKVAAGMLGEFVANFHEKYVHTGRLKIAKVEGKRGKLFFKLEDIAALVNIKKQAINSIEAAAILQVNSSCIYANQ